MEKKVKRPKLSVFLGKSPGKDFLSDLKNLKSFESEPDKIREIIDNAVNWFLLDDVEKEWNEWTSDLSENEKNTLKKSLRFLIFLLKEYFQRHLGEAEFRDDLAKIDFPINHVDYFIEKLNDNKKAIENELRDRVLKFALDIDDIEWRIDKKICDNISSDLGENIVFLKFKYTERGTSKEIVFEFCTSKMDVLRP